MLLLLAWLHRTEPAQEHMSVIWTYLEKTELLLLFSLKLSVTAVFVFVFFMYSFTDYVLHEVILHNILKVVINKAIH